MRGQYWALIDTRDKAGFFEEAARVVKMFTPHPNTIQRKVGELKDEAKRLHNIQGLSRGDVKWTVDAQPWIDLWFETGELRSEQFAASA